MRVPYFVYFEFEIYSASRAPSCDSAASCLIMSLTRASIACSPH